MGTKDISNFHIPNVSQVPGSKKVDLRNRLGNVSGGNEAAQSEFKNLLNEQISNEKINKAHHLDQLAQTQREHGIQLSTHAAKRLQERNIDIDSNEFFKLKDAFQKLQSKGGRDSLVITDKAAYIVDVPAKKVVTAIDKGSIESNVFTKIDSTVLV
ncbi:TIGR02530 family flagellar biosynthesis protein [Halobacteriovorax sp. GFR7]|uniref:TIGR02530 family flagellar biosynthesis protein n=1 Tax=unclassified Halobacteriovorax TaxID=2639665 RepID=UPI00371202BD